MRRIIFYSVMFVTVLLFATVVPVYAAVVVPVSNLTGYAVTRDGASNVLYSIDLTTGTATVIGPTGITYPPDIVEDLAIDKSRNLFAVTANNKLYSIDATTGAASLIGDTGRQGGIEGIAFFGDVLYGIDYNGFGNHNPRVFIINTANATTQDVVELDNGSLQGISAMAALNSTTMLITPVVTLGSSDLYSVDLNTGATTSIGPIKRGDNLLAIMGLAFAPDGTLYGVGSVFYQPSGADFGKVLKINPNTAEAIEIGDTGNQFWLGLAIPSEKPLGALPVSQCISAVEWVNPQTGVTEILSARVRNDFDGCIIEASVIFYKGSDCIGTPIQPSWDPPDPNLVYKSGTRGGCAEAVEVTSSSPVCVELTLKSGRKTTVCY